MNAAVPSSAAETLSSNDPARAAWTVVEAPASDHLAEFDSAYFRAIFRDLDAEGGGPEETGTA